MSEQLYAGLVVFAIIFAMLVALYAKQIRKGNGQNIWLVLMLLCLLIAGLIRVLDPDLSEPLSGLLFHAGGILGSAITLMCMSTRAHTRMKLLLAKRKDVLTKKGLRQ